MAAYVREGQSCELRRVLHTDSLLVAALLGDDGQKHRIKRINHMKDSQLQHLKQRVGTQIYTKKMFGRPVKAAAVRQCHLHVYSKKNNTLTGIGVIH